MALLSILLIAFGLILGFLSKGQAFKKLGRVLLIVALAPIFIGVGKTYYYQMPQAQKIILFLIIIPGGTLIILRILLGKDIFNNVLGSFIYDAIKAVFTFPFKIISKLIRTYK